MVSRLRPSPGAGPQALRGTPTMRHAFAWRTMLASPRPQIALVTIASTVTVVAALLGGLIVGGITAGEDDAEAVIAFGIVALSFTALTGLAAVFHGVRISFHLQQRNFALIQILGMPSRTAAVIAVLQSLVTTLIAGAVGAAGAYLLWPVWFGFVATSGVPLPPQAASLPPAAVWVAVTVVMPTTLIASIAASRTLLGRDLIALSAPSLERPRSTTRRVVRTIIDVLLFAGLVALYVVISAAPQQTTGRQMGDFFAVYPGMGIACCIVFARSGHLISGGLARLLAAATRRSNRLFVPGRELAANPRLTAAIVHPIALAGAAAGIMWLWVKKLADLFVTTPDMTVQAPWQQMVLLLGGPIVVACVSGAAIVFATTSPRQKDTALLLVAGATPGWVWRSLVPITVAYSACAGVCALLIVAVNDAAATAALRHGPLPGVGFDLPTVHPLLIAAASGLLIFLALALITAEGLATRPIDMVNGTR